MSPDVAGYLAIDPIEGSETPESGSVVWLYNELFGNRPD